MANMELDPTTGNFVFGLGSSELEIHEFVEALLRAALAISRQVRQDEAQVFRDVVQTVSAHCKREEATLFRAACRAPAIQVLRLPLPCTGARLLANRAPVKQELLFKRKEKLESVFKWYAAADQSDAVNGTENMDTLNLRPVADPA
jgi:hypothetical protein